MSEQADAIAWIRNRIRNGAPTNYGCIVGRNALPITKDVWVVLVDGGEGQRQSVKTGIDELPFTVSMDVLVRVFTDAGAPHIDLDQQILGTVDHPGVLDADVAVKALLDIDSGTPAAPATLQRVRFGAVSALDIETYFPFVGRRTPITCVLHVPTV